MHFERLKSTRISLKSVSVHLGGNRRRVPMTHGMLRFNEHGNSCRPQYLGKDSDPDCSS